MPWAGTALAVRSEVLLPTRCCLSRGSEAEICGAERRGGSLCGRLLDDLVRPGPHRCRNHDSEVFASLQVQHQLELRRLLDRKILRVGASQNLVDMLRRSASHFAETRTIRRQPAGSTYSLWLYIAGNPPLPA